MKKSDYAFNRNLRHSIDAQARQNKPTYFGSPNPIYIPKKSNRKKR